MPIAKKKFWKPSIIKPQMHTDKHRLKTTMNYTAVIEYCRNTGLYVGYVPSLPGAHSQGETLEELNANLREVISMLLEDGRADL